MIILTSFQNLFQLLMIVRMKLGLRKGKILRLTPINTTQGDETIWAADDPNQFYITNNYFRIWSVGKFPLSYIRSADIVYMSGFQELGFINSLFSIVIGIIIGAFSISGIATFQTTWVIAGIIGLWISWLIIKMPFRKSEPDGIISFHPNLRINDIVLSTSGARLSDEDKVEGIRMLQKIINS